MQPKMSNFSLHMPVYIFTDGAILMISLIKYTVSYVAIFEKQCHVRNNKHIPPAHVPMYRSYQLQYVKQAQYNKG